MKSKFAVRLKKRRLELGMTVKDLGNACGLTHGCISQYENDIRDPGYETLLLLSTELKVTVEYLVGRSEYSLEDFFSDDRMYDLLVGVQALSEEHQDLFFDYYEHTAILDQQKRRNADERHLRTTNRNSR